MVWTQTKSFLLARMGKLPNFCLRNTRLGYNIPAKYANAKQAMAENRKKHTLHPLSSIPKNVIVPVFSDRGVFGHVEVCLQGTYYSDGKKVGKPDNSFQWGEYLNGVQVVKENKPAVIKVGDSVIVNGVGTATSKGTGAETKIYVNHKMKVISIANSRYGLNQYNRKGAITGWWTKSQIKKV